MAGKQAQRHHFIPQVLLRNFAGPDEQLWFWRHDFEDKKVLKVGTKNLFVEKDLYAIVGDTGEKNIALEVRFSMQEEAIASFLRQLLPATRSGARIRLDDAAWRLWHLFFYFLTKRSPGYVNDLARSAGMNEAIARRLGESDAQDLVAGATELHEDTVTRIAKNAIIYAQGQIVDCH